jgi:ABC-type branched-subunit amino acid transport system ATPase component
MMIETRGLRKSFGDHVVLDGIDLDVAAGTICALLGPNGAGKTTTVVFDGARMDKLTYAVLKGLGADLSNVTVE